MAYTVCKRRLLQAGVSLLELSIVILLLSLTLVAILPAIDMDRERKRNEKLLEQFTQIHNALIAFRQKYNRLPCPGEGELAQDNANYGVEASNPNSCTGGSPMASFSTSYTVGGVLPTKTLGMPDMLDPWGRRFSYHVDVRATRTSAFYYYRLTSTTLGEMTVRNSAGADRTTKAIVVALSHGKNGHGAFLPSGVRANAGSTNTQEQLNCSCNSSAVSSGYATVFVMQPQGGTGSSGATDNFDDSGFYFERQHLASSGELTRDFLLTPESLGIRNAPSLTLFVSKR